MTTPGAGTDEQRALPLAERLARIRGSLFFQEMVLTAIGFALYGLTKIAYNYFVLREFGATTLAVNNLSISAAMLVSILISNLFSTSLSRFAPEALGKESHETFQFVVSFNFWFLSAFALIAAGGFLLFSGWIAAQIGGSPDTIRYGSALVVLNTLYTFFKSFSYVVRKVRQYTVLEIFGSVVFFAALFGCLHWNRPDLLLLPFILQFGFFAAVSGILNRALVGNFIGFRELFRRGRESLGMMRYSLISGLGTTGSMTLSHIFTLTLGRIADARVVAFFTSVVAALDPLNIVPRLLTTVAFPRVSRYLGEGETSFLVKFTKDNYRRLLIFTVLACLGALLVTQPVVAILFGRDSEWLVPFFRIMLLARFLPIIGVFHVTFLSGTHYPGFPNLMGPLALVITLPLLSFGLDTAGLVGVGCVVLLSSVIRTVPTIIYGDVKLANFEARKGGA